MEYEYNHREQIPVYANGLKDVPEAFRRHHWMVPVKFDQLQKLQLKVRMCCQKCEEKVKEEIWEVPGVFDVQAERPKKVIVVVMPDPFGLDQKEVLRKAKKIDCRAKFVTLELPKKPDPKPPSDKNPPPPPDKNPPPPPDKKPPSPPCHPPLNPHPPFWPGGCGGPPYHPPLNLQPPFWRGGCGGPSKPQCGRDHVHYFHLLLLALLVFMLVYGMR